MDHMIVFIFLLFRYKQIYTIYLQNNTVKIYLQTETSKPSSHQMETGYWISIMSQKKMNHIA